MPSQELVQAEQDFANQSFRLHRQYPARHFVRVGRPQHGQSVARGRGSLLKVEVQPDDVVERWTTSNGWNDSPDSPDSPGNWKSLGDELAEREAEKDPDVKEYEAMMAETYQRWQADISEPGEEPVDVTALDVPPTEAPTLEAPTPDTKSVNAAPPDAEPLDNAPLDAARHDVAISGGVGKEDRRLDAVSSTRLVSGQPKVRGILPERLQCFRGWLSVTR
ncbi:hypothetical protein LTR08_006589 [Meristemomyces frigidus]|nr:hypothetical protein LTR08_006589 [Meristemomyces frigidus]